MKLIDERYLDLLLVPTGLVVLGIYHLWLLLTIIRKPVKTVIGLNSISRYQWVLHMMKNPENSVLAVQTIRNNLMASTLLATIAITLSSLISAVVSSSKLLLFAVHTTKYLSVLICFLVAFFCNVQCTRYYAHVSFLLNVPPSSSCDEGREEFIEYVAQQLDRGGLFWSLGLRAFYFSFPLLLWMFSAIAMLVCSFFMTILLYFLDSASSSPSYLQYCDLRNRNIDIESPGGNLMGNGWLEHSDVHLSLLGSKVQHSSIF